jgi:hypothetical protein
MQPSINAEYQAAMQKAIELNQLPPFAPTSVDTPSSAWNWIGPIIGGAAGLYAGGIDYGNGGKWGPPTTPDPTDYNIPESPHT